MNTNVFKNKSKILKRLATQLSNLEERPEIFKIEINAATSMDVTAKFYLEGERSSSVQSDDLQVETNFFNSNRDSKTISVRDTRLSDYSTFDPFTITVSEISNLEQEIMKRI